MSLTYQNLNVINISKFNIFIAALRFVKTHEDISKDKSQRRTHGFSINLIIKLTIKNRMSL